MHITEVDRKLSGYSIASRKRRRGQSYILYLAPALVGFVAVVAVPLAFNFGLSLTDWAGGFSQPHFVGLDNYEAVLGDSKFWISFRNSLAMIVAIVVVPIIIGIVIASVLFDYIGRHFGANVASFMRATYYLPQILPVAVAALIWNWILTTQGGALNFILKELGVESPPNWLGSVHLALPSLMVFLVWGAIGFPVVIFMAALQRVDPTLYEAASLDGAGWFTRFRWITVPQIRAEIFVVALMGTIAALKIFGPVLLLTGGGPESSTYVPSYYSYLNFFPLSAVGYGAAIANVLTGVILITALAFLYVQGIATAGGDY